MPTKTPAFKSPRDIPLSLLLPASLSHSIQSPLASAGSAALRPPIRSPPLPSMMATPRKQKQQPPQGAVSVQHVAKASSDELLRKFADPDARHLATTTPPRRSLALRRKRSSRRVASGLSARDSDAAASAELAAPKRRRSIGGSSADWRAGLLLPTTTAAASTRKGQARRGGGAARLDDAAGIGLILAALERTWRKTVAGASKMFVERHRTNHVLLISDMV